MWIAAKGRQGRIAGSRAIQENRMRKKDGGETNMAGKRTDKRARSAGVGNAAIINFAIACCALTMAVVGAVALISAS